MSQKKTTYYPARTLALLWGSQTNAGRSGLTLKAIIEAGIAIADAEGLDALSMRSWELYKRHRWMLHTLTARPVLGPHASLKYEAELRPLEGLGLSDIDMDAALTLVITHVTGCAAAQAALDTNESTTGMSDAEWWLSQETHLNRLVDPNLFPVASRVGMAAGQAHQSYTNPEYILHFGLDRILAGLAELIAKN